MGKHVRGWFDVPPHLALDMRGLEAVEHVRADDAMPIFPLPLQERHDRDLANDRMRMADIDPLLLGGVHVAGLAADVGFVCFDGGAVAAHLPAVLTLERESDALEHEPGGFLRNAERTGNLVAANAVLGVCDDPDARQPLVQTERGILKEGARLEGELPFRMACLALPPVAALVEVDARVAALRAADAIGPATGD